MLELQCEDCLMNFATMTDFKHHNDTLKYSCEDCQLMLHTENPSRRTHGIGTFYPAKFNWFFTKLAPTIHSIPVHFWMIADNY